MRRGRASDHCFTDQLTVCFTLYRDTNRVIQVKQTARAFVANAAARAFPSFGQFWSITRRPFVSLTRPPFPSPEYAACPGEISDPRRADYPPFRALGAVDGRTQRDCGRLEHGLFHPAAGWNRWNRPRPPSTRPQRHGHFLAFGGLGASRDARLFHEHRLFPPSPTGAACPGEISDAAEGVSLEAFPP
jgi:hypothetical protein